MNSISSIDLCFYGAGSSVQFTSMFKFVGQAMQRCGLRCQSSTVKGTSVKVLELGLS